MADGRSSYRVRIAGQEIAFPDLEAIRRLVDEGQIGASAEVRAPGADRWVPLAQALGERPARRDPWAVWEDADHVDPADIWKEFSAGKPGVARPPEEPAELPLGALTPVEEERTRPAEEPRTAGPRMVIDASKRPVGKVIAFPTRTPPARERAETDGPYALAPADPVPLRPPPPPPRPAALTPPAEQAPEPPVRWARVAALLLVGALLLIGLRWYVVGQANERFQPVAGPAPVEPPLAAQPSVPVEPTPPPPGEDAAAGEPYAELEQQLRGRMLSDVRDASTEVALEDALHVELDAVRVEVIRVDVSVLGWAGRKHEQPKVVELQVDLKSDASRLDTDLAAVGLVVGKYVQRYGYQVPRFEVVLEGIGEAPLKIALDPEASRMLYIGRKSMLEYLSARPGK